MELISSKIRELPKDLTLTIKPREGYESHTLIYVDYAYFVVIIIRYSE